MAISKKLYTFRLGSKLPRQYHGVRPLKVQLNIPKRGRAPATVAVMAGNDANFANADQNSRQIQYSGGTYRKTSLFFGQTSILFHLKRWAGATQTKSL